MWAPGVTHLGDVSSTLYISQRDPESPRPPPVWLAVHHYTVPKSGPPFPTLIQQCGLSKGSSRLIPSGSAELIQALQLWGERFEGSIKSRLPRTLRKWGGRDHRKLWSPAPVPRASRSAVWPTCPYHSRLHNLPGASDLVFRFPNDSKAFPVIPLKPLLQNRPILLVASQWSWGNN